MSPHGVVGCRTLRDYNAGTYVACVYGNARIGPCPFTGFEHFWGSQSGVSRMKGANTPCLWRFAKRIIGMLYT